ncbi:MAG: flagellar biosynthetic protein FliR, partial [Spirochaetota bacterium]|nr:flagellar biosynthetic protein FliR [Spirochaetota bacterium]
FPIYKIPKVKRKDYVVMDRYNLFYLDKVEKINCWYCEYFNGVLLLISVSMGLLAKAAPQMNLLMLGFPIKISMAFLMLFLALPFIMEAFVRVIDSSFFVLVDFLNNISGNKV